MPGPPDALPTGASPAGPVSQERIWAASPGGNARSSPKWSVAPSTSAAQERAGNRPGGKARWHSPQTFCVSRSVTGPSRVPADNGGPPGRASCRDREWQSVLNPVVAGYVQQKQFILEELQC